MFLLRLFDRSDPVQPVGAHMLSEGTTRVGRDPAADWAIPDPECEISRHHLELVCRDGALVLRPLGANGVFRDESGERLADGEEFPVALGDAVVFGKYRMVVDTVPFAARAGASFDRTMAFTAPFGENLEVPSEWADGEELPPIDGDGSLLEAFCAGAKLDVSALSGEEPAEIMRRAGAIYRQMVLGLADLTSERSTAKAELSMDRTTIGARGNNPFKWAPTRRLATDLLLGREAGFLSGPAAIKASFEDIKKHMLGTLSGFGAAMRAVLELVGPAAIAKRIDGQSAFLKSRVAICWAEYQKAHGELETQMSEGRDGPVNQAFAAGYQEATRELPAGERAN
ncbi:MAG TPA: type VI secretion system-associated FHA domain protein TagH [Allosphingosinicella sp.]|nr:type VI secretion system-associated FHA domain protein TagH [Allosphingosinicella sp.]